MCDISFKKRLLIITYFTGALAQINIYDDRNQDYNRNLPIDRPDNYNRDDNRNNYDRNNLDRNNFDRTNLDRNNFDRDNFDRNNFDRNNGQANNDRRFQNPPFNGDLRQLLQALDVQASEQCTNNVAAQWNFETNVNQATQLEAVSKLYL